MNRLRVLLIRFIFWPVRSIRASLDSESSRLVLEVGNGPNGLVAPLRFKMLDSQPVKSNRLN